jgi:uncharacterized cupin superfamily protein
VTEVNLFGAELTWDEGDPPGYHCGYLRVGPLIGAKDLGLTVYELPPGQSICPYHYEYAEEWLIGLEGRPTLRQPTGESVLEPGDVVCFPVGPDGAHKVTNTTDEVVRVLMISVERPPHVAVYPDSDKIGVYPGNRDDSLLVRRSSAVPYYDGEA